MARCCKALVGLSRSEVCLALCLTLVLLLTGWKTHASEKDKAKPASKSASVRFYADYPDAANHLHLAATNVRGKAKLVNRVPEVPNPPWLEFEFFLSGEKARVDIKKWTADGKELFSRAMLLTGPMFAEVQEPHTPYAFLKGMGKPTLENEMAITSILDLFKIAHFFYRKPLLEYIRDGSVEIDRLSEDGENQGRVLLSANYRIKDQPTDVADMVGSFKAVFSPDESWATREFHIYPKEPIKTESHYYVDELTRVGEGVVPKRVRRTTNRPGASNAWTNSTELEVQELYPGPVSDSEFTVEALGLAEPGRGRPWLWWTLGCAVVLLAILLAIRKHSARSGVQK